MTKNFEPRILGIFCNWCSYTGADLAGTSRTKYPPNLRIIRVMCSGRVDPQFVLKAFAEGADGVLVAGCHPGDCHYIEGNFKTQARMPLLKNMLRQMGIEPERFRHEWISASEGDLVAKIAGEMTKSLKELGPLNWNIVSKNKDFEEKKPPAGTCAERINISTKSERKSQCAQDEI